MFRLPLADVRVLDLTIAWAGPYATRLMGDMGAEVIKIEAPNAWDFIRTYTGRPPDSDEQLWEKSPYFNHNNRNKYGISLDITTPRGKELFLRLVEMSDVVVENFRAEVMEGLGLGYEALAAVNERVSLISMPAHGKTGPEKEYVAYGTNADQLSGLSHLTGYADGPPLKTGISYGDPVAATAAAGAVALALWERRHTGRGQYIEVAQRETLTTLIGEEIVAYTMTGREPERRGNRHSSMAPHGAYACAGDDAWVTIACENDAQFAALCVEIGHPVLANDERFADVMARYRNQDALDELIARWTRDRSAEDAAVALQAVGVPASPVLSVPAVFADEHLRARGFFETVAHPVAGVSDVEGPHWRMSVTPGHIRLPAPTFAQHNHYVFGHLLGLSDAEIETLEAEGVAGRTLNWNLHR